MMNKIKIIKTITYVIIPTEFVIIRYFNNINYM